MYLLSSFLQIPGLERSLYLSKYDWQFTAQGDGKANSAFKNNFSIWPRGKMLGGCSSINGMTYFRGSPVDYEKWYNSGNNDWHPDKVMECFKKAENLQDPRLLKNETLKHFFGNYGPLHITTPYNRFNNDLYENILQSWDEIGIRTVIDLNQANALGSGLARVTIDNGRRESTDQAYLKPARNRENLDVITNAYVTKILINQNTKEAYGVELKKDDKVINMFASVEVIVSGGTINSPQLLMLSGIGPKQHLESKNIHCVVDLPAVGQYLQDHIYIPVTIVGDEPEEEDQAKTLHFEAIKYIYNQQGYLSYDAYHFVALYSDNQTDTYPKFQNHIRIYPKNSPDFAQNFGGFKDTIVNSLIDLNKNNSVYLFMFILLHPKSMGYLSLNTSDPMDYPIIYPNHLNDTRDVQTAVDGIKKLTKIVYTKYFKSINGKVGRISWPECDIFKLDSEDYWKCIVEYMRMHASHPIGTARMGTDKKTSVVNSKLKVHHIEKLRVVDASVMPSHISANINGAVIMMAERASGMIKRDYGIQVNPDDKCF